MAPFASAAPSVNSTQLLDSLLACPPEALAEWIATHQTQLTLSLLQALKDQYAVTDLILAKPHLAERATRYALLLAPQTSNEPLALPLAHWARGLYEMFYAPAAAVEHFQQARAGYQMAGDTLSVARLAANLVGVLADAGRFTEAEAAYQEAQPEFLRRLEQNPLYLVRLEQNYGWLLHSAGRFSEALAAHERALQVAERYQLVTSIAEVQVNRNLTLGMLGRLAEVEAGFLQERATALAHEQLLTVARIDMNLGDLYTWQGRIGAALQRFQVAQQTFSKLGNEMEVGSILFRQATLLSRIGARRGALRHYAQALAHFTERAMVPQIGELLVHYATARREEGDYRHAAALLHDAEQLWRKLANPLWLAMILLERIALAFEQEDYQSAQQLVQEAPSLTDNLRLQAEFNLLRAALWRVTASSDADKDAAEQAYLDACAYATAHGERWVERRGLIGLGKLWLTTDPTRAIAFLEQAAAIDAAMRQMLTVEELKASFHEQANDLFDDLIALAIERNQGRQALGYIWRAKADALLDLLIAVQDESALTPAKRAEIEQTRQQIATLHWQQAAQAGPTAPQPLQPQTNSQILDLEQHLLALRRWRNRAPDGLHTLFSPVATINPAAILARLNADLLLEYVRCGDELWGVIADRHGDCKGIRLMDVETIAELNARLQLRFGHVVVQPSEVRHRSNDRWLTECLPLLTRCYEYLVAPLLAKVPSAALATSILIAPCDPLFLLPFAAFWDGRQFWGETHQLELIPSGALLATPPLVAATHSPPLIIAASSGAMTAVRMEAACVAETLPASVVFMDAPALHYLRILQSPPRILHIAAHSLIRADAPLFTGLQLAGEVLTVEQCYELPLRGTELVTLSGCTTASGQESESALLAFQTAFLLAGAQRVLTTLWPIADDAAVLWMAHFYRGLATGLTVPQAMQRTQQHFWADPALCHPALWAPFTSTRR